MYKRLSHQIKTLLCGLLCGLFLLGCAPTVKVRSDSNPNVNLTQFSTYDFFSKLGLEQDGYSSLLGQHFRDAVSAQLGSRGFTMTDSPQIQVNVSVSKDDKVRVNTYQDPYLYGGYYGGARRGYWGAPMYYGGGTQTTVSQYTQAYVYIDLVDSQQHKMIWQGVATFVLTEKMQQQVRDAVSKTVAEIFTQFPIPVKQTQ